MLVFLHLNPGGRGFRPEVEGPVDMRFDASEQSETALQYLVRASRQELAAALEAVWRRTATHAGRIADAVALAKAEDPTLSNMTTSKLAQLASAAKGHREYQQMHPAKMTFQALRVAVNREFAELRDGLAAATEACGLNGAVAVLTWKHAECACCGRFSGDSLVGREGFNATQVVVCDRFVGRGGRSSAAAHGC